MADLTVTVKPSGGDYSSLNAALAGESKNLVTNEQVLTIECHAFADTTAVNTGSGYTTDAAHYVHIHTPATERHDGKWNTDKYSLTTGNYFGCLLSNIGNIIIDGLQFNPTGSGGGVYAGIYFYPGVLSSAASGARIYITNNLIRKTNANGSGVLIDGTHLGDGTSAHHGEVYIVNNIIWDFSAYGIRFAPHLTEAAYCVLVCHNNTTHACGYGISATSNYAGNTTGVFKNNLLQSSVTQDFIIATAFSTYVHSNNITSDDSSPDAAFQEKTATFVDATNEDHSLRDFHLAAGDAEARDNGADLSGDGYYPFSIDIDGQTRSGAWDIGADEYVAAGGTTHEVSCSDGLAQSEVNSAACAFGCSITDGLRGGDADSPTCAFAAAIAEGMSLAEIAGVVQSILASVSDSARLGEAATVSCIFNPSAADVGNVGDGPSTSAVFHPTVVDGLTMVEALSAICRFAASITDGFTTGELVVRYVPGVGQVAAFTAHGKTFTFVVTAGHFAFTAGKKDFNFSLN